MRKSLLTISIVILNLVSCFAQDSIDTLKYLEILKNEFNFQVNLYRKSKGLDTIPEHLYLKEICKVNNERLSKIPEFFKPMKNSLYREIAHEGFDYRVDSIYNPEIPLNRLNRLNEIVHSRSVILTNDILKIKKLAKKIKDGFSESSDHNEALLEKNAIRIYTDFKVVTIEEKNYIVVTTIIQNLVN